MSNGLDIFPGKHLNCQQIKKGSELLIISECRLKPQWDTTFYLFGWPVPKGKKKKCAERIKKT